MIDSYIKDMESFMRGHDNGRQGNLVYSGLPSWAGTLERLLCVAGFEVARIEAGKGAYPVLLHVGRRAYWLTGQDATRQGALRACYNATIDASTRPPIGTGYHDLKGLLRLKGEHLA